MPAPILTQSTFTLRADGTLLKDGVPIFLWGHYAVGFASGYEGFKRNVELTAATGGNFMASSWLHAESLARNVELLDYAASLGVGIMMNDIDPAFSEQMTAYGNHRAVYGVDIADDANNYTTAYISGRNTTFRSAMPKVFTYISQATGLAYPNGVRADYSKVSMAVANQLYPIPNDPLSSVVSGMETQATDCAAASPKTLPMVNIDWQRKAAGGRVATPAELTAMTFLALIGGARGLINFALVDQYNRQSNLPEQLAAVRRVRARLLPFVPFFLGGVRTRPTLSSSMVYAAQWTLGGRVLILVANSLSESRPVTLDLTGRTDVQAWGPLRPQGTRLSGILPGHGVAIIEAR